MSLTEDEIERHKKDFKKFDKNNDKFLDLEEIKKITLDPRDEDV